ncbi:Putative magnetosome proteine MamL containing LapA domain [Gammaproteobacteria bacterium]
MKKITARPYSSLMGAMLVLIFTSQNMHEVEIRLIFGSPFTMPLIVIILGAFISGFLVATLIRKNRNRVRVMENIDRE